MKKIMSFLFVSAFMVTAACAQQPKASPSAKETGKAGNANISISYSQPSMKGRKIFGDLVPYGKVWRTGADEATVFETDRDVMIEGKKLAAGKYGLFTIPGENSWTIIFNKTWNQWGAYRYKQDEDVLRVDVKPGKTSAPVEKMTFKVDGDKVSVMWENTMASFNVKG